MTDLQAERLSAAKDIAEAVKFLQDNPGYIAGLSEGSLASRYKSLPPPIRRVILNLGDRPWADALELFERVGVNDKDAMLIEPFINAFRPLAEESAETIKASEGDADKAVFSITAQFVYDLLRRSPMLYLRFVNKDRRVMFETRESTLGTMSTAASIMGAVASSFEYCQSQNVVLTPSVSQEAMELLSDLFGDVKRIAAALNIPEDRLVAILTDSPVAVPRKESEK